MTYIIKINQQKYHTSIAQLPITQNIIRAKQYRIRKFAESDAVRLIMRHSYIKQVDIVELTDFLQE